MNLVIITINILGIIDIISCITDIISTYLKGEFMCKAYGSVILLVVTIFLLIDANKIYYFQYLK